jgi:hypothetical protein
MGLVALPGWLARLMPAVVPRLMPGGAATVLAGALALAAPARAASPPVEPDPVEPSYQRVLGTRGWRGFVAQLVHLHLRPVDETALQAACSTRWSAWPGCCCPKAPR